MTWGSGVDRKADYDRASPCSMCNIPQHVPEPVILEAARERDAAIRFIAQVKRVDAVYDAYRLVPGRTGSRTGR